MTSLPAHEIPIAVVGLGCRFPGADSLDDYWKLISEGRSGIIELPPEKIDTDLYYDPEPGKLGRSYTKMGGVVFERPLDPAICRLPQKLQHDADPAHLIMCEVAAMAFRHAGYDPYNLSNRNAGVYIGHSGGSVLAGEMACHMYTEEVSQYLRQDATFQKFPAAEQNAIIQGVIDRVHRSTASRRNDGGPELGASNVSSLISQAFGLSGPALATDAACASSLIAMAMGIYALRHGHIDMAMVGGASCSKWYALVLFSQAKSISGTGSRPFDANADGLISSDGYAAVVLKTLPKALKDGDHVHAVIRGIGVSSDGRGKSLWAPRKEGQILAVNRAYQYGIDPSWLQYLECHATSTQVGDATELGALNLALRDRLPKDRKLPIGSVKANIGHTLESAGIAGFLKAVLCMQNRTIPGQINLNTPNPDVPWSDIPFYVPTSPQEWPEPVAGRPRRTAVNAFGIGGLNVHVVMDDRIIESTKTQSLVPSSTDSSTTISAASQADDLAIAIVGAASILPGALTLDAFWDLLVSGRDPKCDVPKGRWSPEIYYDPQSTGPGRTRNKRGGYITDFVYDWKKHKVPPKQIANANPLQFMLLDAADQALRDSGYDQKEFDHQRAAVIVGSVYGGDFACEMQMGLRIPEFQKHIREELRSRGIAESQVEELANAYQDLLLKNMPALLDETGSFTASTLASRLTKSFDMMGGAFSLDAADVSSLAAIAAAMGMLQDKAADLVLCAAGQRSMDVNVYEGFQTKNTLAAGDPKPAFSQEMDGIVPGEGAAVLILKRLSDARRDGDKIRGVIRGMGAGLNLDNYSQAYRDAFERSLRQSQSSASNISLVEVASVGTPEVDADEARTLAQVLGSANRAVPAVVTSVTSQIGHTLGVSGMASVLKATTELQHGMVPPTPGLTNPIAEITSAKDVVQPAQKSTPLFATLAEGKTLAAVTNSAANGSVYTLLLEGGDGLPAAPKPTIAAPVSNTIEAVNIAPAKSTRQIRLVAQDRQQLTTLLQSALKDVNPLYATGSTTEFNAGDKLRLSIVTDSTETLERQLKFTVEQLQRGGNTFLLDDKGVFLREATTRPAKVAFLFPGQGSQYAGMLQPLVQQDARAREILDDINATLRRTGCPSFEEMAWATPDRMGSDVFITQLSMLVANVLSYRLLTADGVQPDIIGCHSYGEFPALVASGALSLESAIIATRERTQSVESRDSTSGCLLSTTAPWEIVEQMLRQLRGGAYLASHNAPDQTVLGGTVDAIQGVRKLLEAEGFATRTLAVPKPYHTPLLQDAQPAFAAALAKIDINAPQIPFLSSVSLQRVTSGAAARQNLVDQLVTPVRYVSLVQQLANEGVTVFLEVGPNRVLSRLNQRILAGQSVSLLPLDTPQQPGLEGLLRTRALLAAAGTSERRSPTTGILFFDATQRRRGVAGRNTMATTPRVTAAPAVVETTSVAVLAAPVATTTVATTSLDRAEVAKFMVRYVVDQTGYPEDMVEMTADLEADLGIDSIKKAQLIGELAENFEMAHLASSLSDLSLDDFRTLDSILDFVVGSSGSVVTTPTVVETTAVAVTTTTAVAESTSTTSHLDRAEVAKFMIRYVVDQTGYPEDMVEMTADLEADLGIDSIKKAQLIGELAENFEMAHLASSLSDLSLDDFRTLDSILDFVVGSSSQVTTTAVVESTTVAVTTPAIAETTTTTSGLNRSEVAKFMIRYVVDQTGYPEDMVEMTADLEADLGIDSIKKAQLIGELAENFEMAHLASSLSDLSLDDFRTLDSILDFVVGSSSSAVTSPAVMETTAVAVTTSAIAETTTTTSSLDRSEVAKFMIRYVVDQTGYPEDMVEMTADLEADLGIDSIKKAQLIGELAENFEMAHLASSLSDLSLDDFRTLDSILDFVVGSSRQVTSTAAVVETTTVTVVAEEPATVLAASNLDRAEVAKFMVRYVVDQTGYPEDMVEMTADLEADLGIDSIKKAQLIGELAESFEMAHLAASLSDLSLDDFRTLDSILDFVVGGAQGAATTPAITAAEAAEPAAAELETAPAVAIAAVAESAPSIARQERNSRLELPSAFSVVPVAGSSYDMGLQHGRTQGGEIRKIMERYAAMLGPRLQNMPELDEALLKPTMYFGESEIQELQGIADGAGLPVAAVLAHNLGMYPDYVPGCTQFAFTKRSNPKFGLIHAVNEDSPLSLTLPDCISRIVQIRRPEGGIAHITFSVSGQTGGLNGINAAGLAVTSTLLLDCPRRKETAIGKVHPVVVKRLLEKAETIEDAVKLLRTLDRAGAWSLCLSEFHTDRLCYLEYDGESLEVQEQPVTVLTTNHCLLQASVADVPEHSRHRLARLQQLMATADRDGVPLELAQQALRDRFDLGRGRLTPHATMNTIRRVDNQISIVMRPELGEMYVTPGPRSGELVDTYFRIDIGQLFQDAPAATPGKTNGHAPNGENGLQTVTKVTTSRKLADPQAGLPAEAERVVQRHVLRVAEAPLPESASELPSFAGAVLILGQNKLTDALVKRLTAAGKTVHVLPSDESAVAEVERLWNHAVAPHLFVTTARDEAAYNLATGDWSVRSQTGVLVPFLVCQKWGQLVQAAKLTSSATLIGVTAMGGDFGFSGRIHSFEGGGITGLFKGLRRELAEMTVKVIDAPLEESPDALAGVVLKEAAQKSGPLEVGSIRGRRYRVQAIPQVASAQRRGHKTPHGVWVVTGGARGVTAVVARELGRRFGLTMHLLGSTSEPKIDPSWRNLTEEGMKTLKRTIMDQARAAGKNPANTWKDVERSIEIDRTLQAFRADGIAVRYHACDVADKSALKSTLDRIRQQDGAIHGVVHGAGLEAACKFEKKKRELVKATLAVKVDAAIALIELLANDPLEYFLGFGSTSGRFGGMGQADYSMASDMLCKLCDAVKSQHPDIAAMGLHWPPWADVGMAARPESKIALQSSNLAFMPPLEGAAHVIDETLTITAEGELLFLDKPDLIDTDGTMPLAAEKPEYVKRDTLVKSAAVIDSISNLTVGKSVTAIAEFNPTVEPFLLEHRHQGQPILPAVVGMESMAETATILAGNGHKVVGLRNMTVHQGLRFHNDRNQRARVIAEQAADGTRCRLDADFCDRNGRLVEAHRLQMDATLDLAADYSPLAAVELGPQPTTWTTHKYVVDWRTMKFPEEARVYHGYPFQALQDYALVDGGLWARLVVPEPQLIAGERNTAGWQLPSATIDAGLLASDLLVWNTLHVADLPHAFDRIQFARPLVPGEKLTLRAWLRGRTDRMIRADFVMVDAQGQVVIRVDGYEMVEVKSGTSASTSTKPDGTTATATVATAAVTPAVVASVAAAPVAATVPAKTMTPVKPSAPIASGPAPAPLAAVSKPRQAPLAGTTNAANLPAPAPLPGRVELKPATFGSAAPQSTSPAATAVPVTAAIPKVDPQRVAELPLVDAARWETAEKLIADFRFDPVNDPFLAEHLFSNRPLLPAVIGMESMIEAASLTAPAGAIPQVRDFQIVGPCKFRDDSPQSAQVVVERVGDAWKCTMTNVGPKTLVYQTAIISFTTTAAPLDAPKLEEKCFPYNPMQYAAKGQAQLTHGPKFQCLKGLSLHREIGWGKVKAAAADNLAGHRTGKKWFLPVAAMDSCLVACGVDLFILMRMRVEIPNHMDEVRIARLPKADETCTLQLHYRGHNEQRTIYDLFLFGEQGDVLLTVKGYYGTRTVKTADAGLWDGESSHNK